MRLCRFHLKNFWLFFSFFLERDSPSGWDRREICGERQNHVWGNSTWCRHDYAICDIYVCWRNLSYLSRLDYQMIFKFIWYPSRALLIISSPNIEYQENKLLFDLLRHFRYNFVMTIFNSHLFSWTFFTFFLLLWGKKSRCDTSNPRIFFAALWDFGDVHAKHVESSEVLAREGWIFWNWTELKDKQLVSLEDNDELKKS